MRGDAPVLVPPDVVARIRERFNISDVAARLGFKLKQSRHEYVGLCPIHNERTPSWTLNDAKGFAHCFGCGAHHDTIGLVRVSLGYSFVEALRWLDSSELPSVDPVIRQEQERRNREDKEEAIRWARTFFADADDVRRGDPVDTYLSARSIHCEVPPTIRFGMVPSWQDRETRKWGRRRPCMVCAIQQVDGRIDGIQRVFFLDDDPSKGKAAAKLSLGSSLGGAIRIGGVGERVHLAEGPEDGLTIWQRMPERPVWVTSTGCMPAVEFPAEVRSVTICGQNNKAGRIAVGKTAASLRERGLEARAAFPPIQHDDWNDWERGICK